MLDPKLLRQDPEFAAKQLAVRGYKLDIKQLNTLENQRKDLQVKVETLQNDRNVRSKNIGKAKAQGEDIQRLLDEVAKLGDDLEASRIKLEAVNHELNEILFRIPNIPQADVPKGKSEADNVEIRTWGKPKKFSFTPKDHVALGERNNGIDFKTAAKITGSRFVILNHQIARLHRALTQFMLDTHTKEHGYQEIYVPYLVNQESLFGTGQLPKMADDLFTVSGENNYALIPTAEVPVTNIMRDEIIDAGKLPLKLVCHTPCFRSEAGSYGKDTHGMIRQHQFEKVELVQIVPAEDSDVAHEELTSHAEAILQKLELPYRVVILCGGDLGFSSSKTYDLEVWLPGQNCYREISSCSNFKEFQARRMQARMRRKDSKKPELVHTLNGSGLAVGRTLIAVMENYQDEQGRIHIPQALRSYMDGKEILE